jgi:hypothetical protein
MKETAIATYRSTATKAKGMGRTFGLIGAVYASTECAIETVRPAYLISNQFTNSRHVWFCSIVQNRTCKIVFTQVARQGHCFRCQVRPRAMHPFP